MTAPHVETQIRALADSIYFRVDWNWAQARPPAVSMGWHRKAGSSPRLDRLQRA